MKYNDYNESFHECVFVQYAYYKWMKENNPKGSAIISG